MIVANVDILVVGAGQAGLSAGYYLKKARRDFLIIDANENIGDSWLKRWDSLRLFTPRKYCQLPGKSLPKTADRFPTKYQIAMYLRDYVQRYKLPIKMNALVKSVVMKNGIFEISIGKEVIVARRLIIATGAYKDPFIPDCAKHLDSSVEQLHSSEYKNPSQFGTERVVVVGGGNSAAQIAIELQKSKQVALVSRKQLHYAPVKLLGYEVSKIWPWGMLFRITKYSRLGNRLQAAHDTIVGTELDDLIRHGRVRHFVSQVIDAPADKLKLQDGTEIPVQAVLWATGYKNSYDWLKIPGALDGNGRPIHDKGVSVVNGLYWIGLPWQSDFGSAHIYGVGRDSKRIVRMLGE